jgi:hypothetical protein
LKLSFNKSGQNCHHRLKRRVARQKPRTKTAGRVMTTITSESLSSPAGSRDGHSSPFAGFRAFWHQFLARAFDPYRPELHYMRGPGPAWRAKHMASSRPHSN